MAEEIQTETSRSESKYFKVLLVILAAAFMFGGPYLTFVFTTVLDIDYAISMISGLVFVIVGLIILGYLIRKKIVF